MFIITVDGVHCHVDEPSHKTLSKNPKCHSHKSGQAGLDCQLGISVCDSRLVWMSDPHMASVHDMTVFREQLMTKIPAGKKVIGDKGCGGEKAIISTPDSHDPKELRRFKSRARARHESFNANIKNILCMDSAMASSSTKFASRPSASLCSVNWRMGRLFLTSEKCGK
jgi:hypothetical protein